MILEYLDESHAAIQGELFKHLGKFIAQTDYSVVWKEYEDQAVVGMVKIIRTKFPGLGEKCFERGEVGKSKNRLADLLVRYKDEVILISVKACRASADSANDLGTFRQYPTKRRNYTGIFDIWVRYEDVALPPKVTGVFFDRSFKFVGKMTIVDGVAYRKKDGNMRPKPWSMFDNGTCFWNTLEEFEAGMQRSIKFRANSLVNEHLQTMDEDDQRALYECLKAKFGSST